MASERASVFSRARSWYGRYERPISSLSLISGFVFDAVTLTRVDEALENIWVGVHLGIVVIAIVLINLLENTGGDEANPKRLHFWLVNVLQFFFGGLLSVYLVFYFRTGTITTSWPFLLILVLAFWANESLKRQYERLSFQIALLFLSIYAFAIYLMPILVHAIGTWVFVLSGIASLAGIGLILAILAVFSREKFRKSRTIILAAIIVTFFGVNLLYFFHLIPPLPLSLADGGIYHALLVNGPGDYAASSEKSALPGVLAAVTRYFAWSETINLVPGDPLYAYSAVFSPTALNTDVIHEWQWHDDAAGRWTTRARVTLSVVGGRDGGYRTFSMLSAPEPGSWRVNVLTPQGSAIGSMRFTVVAASTTPLLATETIN